MKHTEISEEARKYHFWRGFRSASIVFGLPLLALVIACNYAIDAMLGM